MLSSFLRFPVFLSYKMFKNFLIFPDLSCLASPTNCYHLYCKQNFPIYRQVRLSVWSIGWSVCHNSPSIKHFQLLVLMHRRIILVLGCRARNSPRLGLKLKTITTRNHFLHAELDCSADNCTAADPSLIFCRLYVHAERLRNAYLGT